MSTIFLPPILADQVWSLLVREAGAREDERADFVAYVSEPNRSHEWRFMGLLGGGGKLYVNTNNGVHVGCYAEDETPKRRAIIDVVNAALRRMAWLWILQGKGAPHAP